MKVRKCLVQQHMDNINFYNMRVNVFKQLTNKKQIFFYKNIFDLMQIHRLVSQFNIRAKIDIFEDTVGDIILGFYKIEDTVPLLQQELILDAKTAALLGAEVIDFLAPLFDPNWQPPPEDTDEETAGDIPNPETNISDVPGLENPARNESSIFVTELKPTPNFVIPNNLQAGKVVAATTTVIPDIHTMASDATLARSPERNSFEPVASDEIIHTSHQPEVRTQLSNLPAYTNGAPEIPPVASLTIPETPRWGS